jgi:hypothetical protein
LGAWLDILKVAVLVQCVAIAACGAQLGRVARGSRHLRIGWLRHVGSVPAMVCERLLDPARRVRLGLACILIWICLAELVALWPLAINPSVSGGRIVLAMGGALVQAMAAIVFAALIFGVAHRGIKEFSDASEVPVDRVARRTLLILVAIAFSISGLVAVQEVVTRICTGVGRPDAAALIGGALQAVRGAWLGCPWTPGDAYVPFVMASTAPAQLWMFAMVFWAAHRVGDWLFREWAVWTHLLSRDKAYRVAAVSAAVGILSSM